MNPLILEDVCFMKIKDGNLVIMGKERKDYVFPIGRFETRTESESVTYEKHGVANTEVEKFDSIICPRGFGSVTMSAVWWLSQHHIPIYFIDLNGEMYSSLIPTETQLHGHVRFGQYRTYENKEKRGYLSKQIIAAKIKTQMLLLESLGLKQVRDRAVGQDQRKAGTSMWYFLMP
jgi:CRISPR/Cas system-associated endonuclease Cas1